MPILSLSSVTVMPEIVPPLVSETTPLTEDDCCALTAKPNAANTTKKTPNTLRNAFMNPPESLSHSRASPRFQILVQQLVNHIHKMAFEVTAEYVSETTVLAVALVVRQTKVHKFRFVFVYFL